MSTAQKPRSVDEHVRVVAALLAATPVISLPLVECAGLALAEPITAAVPLPPFDNSGMDGYAVRSVDIAAATADAPARLPVTEDIPAGRTDSPALRPGTAHRIMTGAPIPPGANAVVPVELTDRGCDHVQIYAPRSPGDNVRPGGGDVAAGEEVLPAGAVLGPAQLGVAAAVGYAELPVHRPVRVLVLSTGSELVVPGTPLRHGQIYESNGTMLAAAVREAGGEAQLMHFVPDDVAALEAALAPRLSGIDLLVTSGGVSAGAYEVVKSAMRGHGVDFGKVAMNPGSPQGVGRYRGVPVAAMPGNPVSASVSFEVFVRPALRAAMGLPAQRPRSIARLTEALESPADKRQFRRGALDPAAGTVAPVGGPGSHLLGALARSNCLIDIPETTTVLEAGEQVVVLRTGV
ncbi:MAG: molybdopterin molybdotransferase MoeA [Pseudonocardiales bacterium]|nr:molybdopterin molybdotransferase MoeA [Pseudonocardiales bacterium]MBW0008911.1 molybdopterin molybdotransferase MoeA [Pseudonocardiales bacterium]